MDIITITSMKPKRLTSMACIVRTKMCQCRWKKNRLSERLTFSWCHSSVPLIFCRFVVKVVLRGAIFWQHVQFLDKSTINYAAALDFKQDLHINGSQYSLIGSIFYLGYLLYQVGNFKFQDEPPWHLILLSSSYLIIIFCNVSLWEDISVSLYSYGVLC